MMALHSVLPELARRETRTIQVGQGPGLPAGEYAFVEFFCEDLGCDCRRAFLQVWTREQPGKVLASINYGWEPESFYRERMVWDPKAPREVVRGALDPLNPQSVHARELLAAFQKYVADEAYRERLKRHAGLFREEIRKRQELAGGGASSGSVEQSNAAGAAPAKKKDRTAAAHQQRFDEVANLITQFAGPHLDAELEGFALELWRRLCRRRGSEAVRGQAPVWAASVIHVIARMNFLFDRSQPVHLTFDTICGFFQVSKVTVGGKATQIERTLRLRQHSEPGLCRKALLEAFTTVRLSNGMILSFEAAKKLGYVPAEVEVEDL